MYVNTGAAGINYFHGSSPSGGVAGAVSRKTTLSHAFFPPTRQTPEGDGNRRFNKQPGTDWPSGSQPRYVYVLRARSRQLQTTPRPQPFSSPLLSSADHRLAPQKIPSDLRYFLCHADAAVAKDFLFVCIRVHSWPNYFSDSASAFAAQPVAMVEIHWSWL